jgi:hypothetical protein
MPSDAYVNWCGGRTRRFDELLAAHRAVGGVGRGRRWRTYQINCALILLLAAEFQGYARDLHTLSADLIADAAGGSNFALANVVRSHLTANRFLDRGNATPSNLGLDFARFGLALWPTLSVADPRTGRRQQKLEALVRTRNALAHADEGALAALRQAGHPILLATVRGWKAALDELARTMDDVLSVYLDGLLGKGRPW